MRVLIAGCGYVGTALGERLAAAGHEVWGLRRRALSSSDIRPVIADLRDRTSLDAIPRGLEQVVYAASPDVPDDAGYRDAYARGLTNLLDLLRTRGERLRRLVFVSSTSVYAQTEGAWVDETSPTEPTHHSGQRLLEAEAVAAATDQPTSVIRFAGIYGPGRTRLLERVRAGEARVPVGGPRWTNRIHRDDCAGAIAHLLALEEPAPLYLGVDHEPVDYGDVVRWLARELDAPEPPSEDPSGPAAAGGGVQARRGRSSKRCSSRRLRESGYVFEYPTFREGYGPLVDSLRA